MIPLENHKKGTAIILNNIVSDDIDRFSYGTEPSGVTTQINIFPIISTNPVVALGYSDNHDSSISSLPAKIDRITSQGIAIQLSISKAKTILIIINNIAINATGKRMIDITNFILYFYFAPKLLKNLTTK